MSDSKPEAKPTISANTVTTLVTALAEGIRAARNAGTALATFCAAAVASKLPAHPIEADVDAIVEALAAKMEWAGTARERVNKAEARSIVRVHAELPEGLTAFRTATGACGYGDAVRVARAIKTHDYNVPAAVEALTAESTKKASPDAAITRALQSYWRAMQNGKRKDRNARMEAVAACALALGLKLKTE